MGVQMSAVSAVQGSSTAKWYWEETQGHEHNHDPATIINKLWVAYPPPMSTDIEAKWKKWEAARNDPSLREFSVTIRSFEYKIDLGAMTQTKTATSFVRRIHRFETKADVPTAVPPPPPVIQRKGSDPGMSVLAGSVPVELQTETQLVVYTGALVQVSKTRDDGWSYGNVVFSPNDNPPTMTNDSWSLDAGWFPVAISRAPVQKDLEKLNERMGSGAADCLTPPPSWSKVQDPMIAECVNATAAEEQEVEAAFRKTAPPGITVTGVHRVQNVSMWQSYAVKRQTIMSREKGTAAERLERRWLFHGTNIEVLDKIVQQGFNRSFCGKNATMYGKGVYFARDSKYSCSTTYSVPDSSGIQHMFACRVTVGEYCLGRKDVLTPDIRTGNVLYDSTVDNPPNPALFVTYHDAQAYPEYIIHFHQ